MRRIFAVAMMSAPLFAAADTGNELQANCKSSTEMQFCLGYISGVIGTQLNWRFSYESDPRNRKILTDAAEGIGFAEVVELMGAPPKYCLREGVTRGQTQKVVVKYLDENPQKLDESANLLIAYALSQAFPCPRKK